MKPPFRNRCCHPWSSLARVLSGLVLLMAMTTAQPAGDDPPAVDQVRLLQETLLNSMRSGVESGFEGRFQLLAPVIERTHNLERIARSTLGSHWADLDEAQRLAFTRVFTRLSIATYAARFDKFSGERFEILEERDLPRDQKLLRSQLVKANNDRVRFDYVLDHGDAGWKIVNILVDGVSDLALKRAEYRNVLAEQDLNGLMEQLEEKTDLAEQGRVD